MGEACLPSNAYYPRTPDYILFSGVHVCWSEHSDSSFVYGFMSLDYGLGTMIATTYYGVANCFVSDQETDVVSSILAKSACTSPNQLFYATYYPCHG